MSAQLLQSLKPGKATLSITREWKGQPAERTKKQEVLFIPAISCVSVTWSYILSWYGR